jgi:NitT/TauT family transport system substrate-binding protein
VGKTIAATAGGAPSALWPALAAANNIEPDSVEVVYVDAAAKIPVVLEGKADGLFGAVGDQDVIMRAQGVPVNGFRFDENGVVLLNLGIFVHEDLIEENPDLIRRFLRATRKIITAYYDDPDSAVAGLVAAKPELTTEVAKKQAAGFYARVNSPNCPGSDLLYNCPDDWQITIDILKNYRGMEENISLERCYTNEFLE